MESGDITEIIITLRPTKLVFVVDPEEEGDFNRAIQASLLLWGGIYNPIIPAYKNFPRYWSDPYIPNLSADIVCKGYIRHFDPDVVVLCGNVAESQVPEHVKHRIRLDELARDLSQGGVPTIGTDLLEVLQSFAREEFRFVRKDGMKVILPSFADPGSMFLRSVFGEIPPETREKNFDEVLRLIEIDQPRISLDNFLETLVGVYEGKSPSPSSLSKYRIKKEKKSPLDRYALSVFVMNHDDSLDIVDFWNLRALGIEVIPVPFSLIGRDTTKDLLSHLIKHFLSLPGSDKSEIVFIRSRSISNNDFEVVKGFATSIINYPTIQHWYPIMWDENYNWASWPCSSLVADRQIREIRVRTSPFPDSAQFRSAPLPPPFLNPRVQRHFRYANDIKVLSFGCGGYDLEALLFDEKYISKLFQIWMPTDWLTRTEHLTVLPYGFAWDSIVFFLPKHQDAIEVVKAILEDHGWKNFNLSSSGKIASEMVELLGGLHMIDLIRNEKLIKFLNKYGKRDGFSIGDFQREVENKANLKKYIEAKIFKLGIRVQCPDCSQHLWFSLDELKYNLCCSICLSNFDLPTEDPRKIKWRYKIIGPFALPKKGDGAYSVLFTVYFLANFGLPATVPVFSFKVSNNRGKESEIDFMMIYRERHIQESYVLFGECKSYNDFSKKDVEKMGKIAESFSTNRAFKTVVVFSTMKDEFSEKEKKLLSSFVQNGKFDFLLFTKRELYSNILNIPNNFYPNVLRNLCDETLKQHLKIHET